jgi:hypothetical protein
MAKPCVQDVGNVWHQRGCSSQRHPGFHDLICPVWTGRALEDCSRCVWPKTMFPAKEESIVVVACFEVEDPWVK